MRLYALEAFCDATYAFPDASVGYYSNDKYWYSQRFWKFA